MQEPRILRRTQFGNPVLRTKTKRLSESEILSPAVQRLIADMQHTCKLKQYGVGLAATQVGSSLAIAIIQIKKTPSRPEVEPFEEVIVNPTITKYHGKPEPMWEGCISFSSVSAPVFAQAQRHKKVSVTYYDQKGKKHERILEGFVAHVFQHETDHCDGVLFVDRVKDSKTWMNAGEYKKLRRAELKKRRLLE